MVFGGFLRIPARLSLLLLLALHALLGGDSSFGTMALSANSVPSKNLEQLNIAFVTGNKMKVRSFEINKELWLLVVLCCTFLTTPGRLRK